jgi:predicted ribosomally synthesized peptide with SipW-like signal peptide
MNDDTFDLTRRKALAALGTIGVASAGAGLGTSAYFSDQETFENNQLTAGTLDLKVAWQEHYSNWMDDDYGTDPLGRPLGVETEFARMPDGGEQADLYLPPGDGQSDAQPIQLVFEDDDDGDAEGGYDSRPDEADGGRQFLRNTQRTSVNGGLWYGPDSLCGEPNDADGRAVFEVDDVKPGDFGMGLFRLELCDNPGYLWLDGNLVDASENGTTEPEADDPDEQAGVVELLDEIQVAYAVGTTRDLTLYADPSDQQREESPLPLPATGGAPQDGLENQTTLRDFLNQLSSGTGIELPGDVDAEDGGGTGSQGCFSGGTSHYASVVWWLPIDHGNQVQGDSVTFDLGFYTEQCRHNDGSGMAPESTPLTADSQQGQGGGFANAWDVSETLARTGSGSWGTIDRSGQSITSYKQGFYFAGDFDDVDALPSTYTVADIEEVSYWLYEPTALEGVDIYLNIYTRAESDGDDAAWYDSRLQALPSEANGGSPNFTPGEWNEFSTATGASNTLTWSDTGRGGNFNQPLPTLDDVQSGPVDWSTYGANASFAHDYRDEEVLALSLQTGSQSGVALEAYIDDVSVKLASGETLRLDLEP